MKMLAQIADLRLCALMSMCPYVPAPLCLRPYVLCSYVLRPYVLRTYVLRPFVRALMS